MTELIITNGDEAADVMGKAGFEADIVPWRDVLHEGPVPETDSLENLSKRRAAFLAAAFNMPLREVVDGMAQRDRTLRDLDRYDRVTLWFEHDLYDQLQLLQLLDFFHHEAGSACLHLVQADDYLGRQTPDELKCFAMLRATVSAQQKKLAADLFKAFRQSTPVDLASFLQRDLSPLPHMKAALRRLFAELPDSRDGLSRTQRQALMLIESEKLPPKKLFGAVQATEDAMFMGDWSFWRCVEELACNTSPLISGLPARFCMAQSDEERQRYLDCGLVLTDRGRAVLAGETDHTAINSIDRWLGGTHLADGAIWRWNRQDDALKAPA